METKFITQTFVGGWSGMQLIRSNSFTTGHSAETGMVPVVPGSRGPIVLGCVEPVVPGSGGPVVLDCVEVVVPGSGVPVVPGSGAISKANIK